MTKTAQMPSQYDYGGYEQALDNPDLGQLGYLPGVTPTEPTSQSSNWLLPAGLVAGGLTGAMLLRGAGRRIGQALRGAGPKPFVAPAGSWELDMLGRKGKRYESLLHPGETVGHGYVPGVEEAVKTSSISIIRTLGQIARSK